MNAWMGRLVTRPAPEQDRRLSPTRWAVFELEPDPADGRPRFWLRSTAAPDVADWATRQLDSLADRAPAPIVRYRDDWSMRLRARTTKSSVAAARRRLVRLIERDGVRVLPDPPMVVYAIELDRPARDGRIQLYVGITSNLERRLAQHRQELDGPKPVRAVTTFGYGRPRPDLVGDLPSVSGESSKELEAQVSALLAHRGFKVHGDGTRRRPTSTSFVTGVSWQDLLQAYERANPRKVAEA